MIIQRVQGQYLTNFNNTLRTNPSSKKAPTNNDTRATYAKVPIGHTYGANIHFGEYFDPNRTVPHIDYEEYMAMKPHRKLFFRKRYESFEKDNSINKNELFDQKDIKLPLKREHTMDEFIKTAKIYSKYKDQPIICLGRSPKWFLNAALWMKDGIDDYKFVAFSKYWYWPDKVEGVKKMSPQFCPTDKEVAEYRKYLNRIKADPKTIVDNFEKTGKKTVITDYISTGKGVASFLDVMGNYADDLGILEKFSKAIQIVGIGSKEYMEERNPYEEYIPDPEVFMPEKMQPYYKNVKQEFYDIDYCMFREMLLNQNTNECRSTYYPHQAWAMYKPDRFKTGLVKDLKKIKTLVREKKAKREMFSHFTPAMFDFRNLLNFRILDGLNSRKLLKAVHKSKV